MFNSISKQFLLTTLFFLTFYSANSQISESYDCSIDTVGYAAFLPTLTPNENATFQFHVNGTFAVAYGVIDRTTPLLVKDLISNSPSVTTIVMYACPGSKNDKANLKASLAIYKAGYKMYIPFDGWVASGATDMFLAGSIRVIENTKNPVGVHSWSGGSNNATDYSVGHKKHQSYIDYYENIGFTTQEAEEFYYFTINSAPANGVHWMTELELSQYKFRACENSTFLK